MFVDSPLSVNATEIYRLHPGMFQQRHFGFPAHQGKSVWHGKPDIHPGVAYSKKLNDLKEPAVIISASGMCEAAVSGTI